MLVDPSRPRPELPKPAPEDLICLPPEELICKAPEEPSEAGQSLAPTDNTGVMSLMGSALKSVNLNAAAPPAPPATPALHLLGLKQGDKLEVDGTTTADGSATVKTLNDKNLELQTLINIPYVARGLADDYFTLSGGKVNLSIKVTREGDQYRYQLLDNNAGGAVKGTGLSQLKIKEGSHTESSLWGSSKQVKTQTLSLDTSDGVLTIRLQQKGDEVTGSVSIPGLPSLLNTFDLEKE